VVLVWVVQRPASKSEYCPYLAGFWRFTLVPVRCRLSTRCGRVAHAALKIDSCFCLVQAVRVSQRGFGRVGADSLNARGSAWRRPLQVGHKLVHMAESRSTPRPATDAYVPTSRRKKTTRVPPKPGPAGGSAVVGPFGTPRAGQLGAVHVERVSEVARTVGPLLEMLSPAAAGQLVRLVGNSLSAPPAGLLRDARLGLLVRLLKGREGELVEVRAYEEERLQLRESGEGWPAATTVARVFNGWLGAQLAAMRLAWLGTRARTPRCYDHAGSRPAYTTAEVLQVLIDERRVFGVWLLNNEHLEFGEQRRRMAKALGHPAPRIPTNQVFSRLFGGYGEALARAQALTGELPAAPDSDQPPLSLMPKGDDFTAGAERLDPSARLWWHTIRGLTEPDRRYLHRALTRRARTHHSLTAELMLSALERCIKDQPEDIVSYRGYQTWREAQPDPEEWPTASVARLKLVDGWRGAGSGRRSWSR
jgi:hypothetical protein